MFSAAVRDDVMTAHSFRSEVTVPRNAPGATYIVDAGWSHPRLAVQSRPSTAAHYAATISRRVGHYGGEL